MQTIRDFGCFTIQTWGKIFPLFGLVAWASTSIGVPSGSGMKL